jgi:hypothetical protein
METIRRIRAMASLCRQTAAYRPDAGWRLLAEAEYWDHLADGMLLTQTSECSSVSYSMMRSQRMASANDKP